MAKTISFFPAPSHEKCTFILKFFPRMNRPRSRYGDETGDTPPGQSSRIPPFCSDVLFPFQRYSLFIQFPRVRLFLPFSVWFLSFLLNACLAAADSFPMSPPPVRPSRRGRRRRRRVAWHLTALCFQGLREILRSIMLPGPLTLCC